MSDQLVAKADTTNTTDEYPASAGSEPVIPAIEKQYSDVTGTDSAIIYRNVLFPS